MEEKGKHAVEMEEEEDAPQEEGSHEAEVSFSSMALTRFIPTWPRDIYRTLREHGVTR